MRTVIAQPCCQLPIGRLGENIATRVIFEVAEFGLFGEGGTFSLLHQRPGDAGPYPVTVTHVGTQVIWEVSGVDTGVSGYGRAQLTYTVNGTIAKNEIYTTVIGEALSGGIEPPEPWEDWVNRVLEIGDHLDEWLGKTAGGEPGQVWTRTEDGAGWEDGGSSGTYDHRELENRDAADQHPMSAITGLTELIPDDADEDNKLITADDLDEAISGITELIPSGATSSNKLVTAEEMGDAIEAVEAKQLYKTASQGSFATKAELTSATAFYNAAGEEATPTVNDVAYVLADESHDGKSAKYVIAAVDPVVWGFVITFSDATFSQAQINAINSGITEGKREGYDSHVENSTIHVTSQQKTEWSSKQSTTITDIGGYFTSDTVEGALQEIGAALAGVDELIGSGVIE